MLEIFETETLVVVIFTVDKLRSEIHLSKLAENKFPIPHITTRPQLWGLPGHCGVETNPGLFEKQLDKRPNAQDAFENNEMFHKE